MTAILYAAKGAVQALSDLYTINGTTVADTSVGAIGSGMTGMAFDPTTGFLYGIANESSANKRKIYTIDTTTGAGTIVATLSPFHVIPDIAFDSTGQMYGLDNTANRFSKIDKGTGAITNLASVPTTSNGGYGVSVNSSDVIYIFPSRTWGEVYTVNPTTGAYTLVHALDDSGLTQQGKAIGAASFRSDDVLYVVTPAATPSALATVNLSTGVLTEVGLFGSSDWDALTWDGGAVGGGDITPPTRLQLLAFRHTVQIVYDEPLDEASIPLTSDFTVTVNGVPTVVSAVTVVAETVTLTVTATIMRGDTVLVSYTG